MKRAFALLTALTITPALAGVPSVQHSLRPYQECVHKLTGLPIPATPPRVVYSPAWSKIIGPEGACCDAYGQRVYRGRSYSTYYPLERTITMYRSARPEALIHEMAADAWVQAKASYNPFMRERIGYDAESRAPFECEGLE